MTSFAPNTNLDDARRLRAIALLLMAVFLFVTFGLLAAGVDDHRLLTRLDAEAKDGLHVHARAHPELLQAMAEITDLGRNQYLVLGSITVIAVLAVLRCWRLAGIWAVTTLGGFKLVQILKEFYERSRPQFLEPFVLELPPGSFPSGHTADATMFYGMLAYLLIRATRRVGWFIAPVLGLLILLIGFSRVYLGAHWLSDVVGGWVLGFGWVALGMAAAEETREY